MSGFEWFLLIVIVIAVPLIVAVAVTLWTLEQARQRNRRFRETGSTEATPTKRKATREAATETGVVAPAAAASDTTQATTGNDTDSDEADVTKAADDEDDHDAPPTIEPSVAPATLSAEAVDPDAQWKPDIAIDRPDTQETPDMPETPDSNAAPPPADDSASNVNTVHTGFSETASDNPEVDTDAVQVSTTTPVAPDTGEGDPAKSDTSSWDDGGETRTSADSEGHVVEDASGNPRSDSDAGPST
jgi:hypothetical protein